MFAKQTNKSQRISPRMMSLRCQAGRGQRVDLFWPLRVWQVEFPSTVEANFVGAMFDREHATEMTVPAAENKLEYS